MFSKNLFKLSSYAINRTKSMTTTNRMIKTIQQMNAPKPELPLLMKLEPQKTQFPFMIPSKISFFYKTFVDKSYDENKFIELAKQTVLTISSHLANDNIEGIKSLVTKEAFRELSENFKILSSEQKNQLRVDINDILQCFPLGITVNRTAQNAFDVNILVLIDILNDSTSQMNQKILSHIQTKEFFDESVDFKIKILESLIEKRHICLLGFSRKYGSEESRNWSVSLLTHIRINDMWKLQGLIH